MINKKILIALIIVLSTSMAALHADGTVEESGIAGKVWETKKAGKTEETEKPGKTLEAGDPVKAEETENRFGNLLYSDENVDIWWSAGTFRIMPDTRQPEKQDDIIRLKMAGNEYESVQIVVRNRKPLDNVRLKVSDFTSPGGVSNFTSPAGVSQLSRADKGSQLSSSDGASNFTSPAGVSQLSRADKGSQLSSSGELSQLSSSDGVSDFSRSDGVSQLSSSGGVSNFTSPNGVSNFSNSARVSNFSSSGGVISSSESSVRKVEYIYVSKPTDSYGSKGWWPDPLPLVEGAINLEAGINNTFFVTLYSQPHQQAGIYHGEITISWRDFKKTIPVEIEIWDFSLPKTPSVRSGFGLSYDKIAAYHNITDRNQLEECYDLYMEQFRRYRLAPYYPHALAPARDSVTGILWKGGEFKAAPGEKGLSLLIDDTDATTNIKSEYIKPIPVSASSGYTLEWRAMTGDADQQFCVLLEGYNQEGEKLIFENRMELFTGTGKWKNYRYNTGIPGDDVAYYRLTLFPAFRSAAGEFMGMTWFDDIRLTVTGEKNNLIEQGDFEIDQDKVDVVIDFSRFDAALERYLDDFGFNSFRIDLPGMGSGTYYSREEGRYGGFSQGTATYERLMISYLSQMEAHLRGKGWLNKVYVYWFDEPGRIDYPFVRDGMELIRRGAPGIATFLTENDPGPEIMDVTDISCTIWHRIDPEKAKRVKERGKEYWSYLCTAPKNPWLSEFIDHDGINLRMWLWGTWAYNLDGILIWSTNYWNSYSASPPGFLQNPWEDPAAYVQGYGWPLGKQTQWGNGDGRLFYPPNRDPGNDLSTYIEEPVPSFRLEQLREGIEDYEYLTLLKSLAPQIQESDPQLYSEAVNLLTIPATIFKDGKTYTKDPADLLSYRSKVALMIERLTGVIANQN